MSSSPPQPDPVESAGQGGHDTLQNQRRPEEGSVQNASGRHGQRGRNRRGGNNKTKFKGKSANLSGAVYDLTLPNSSQDLFSKTTREIAKYVSREFENAGEFCLGLVNLSLPPILEPVEHALDDVARFVEFRVVFELHFAVLAGRDAGGCLGFRQPVA